MFLGILYFAFFAQCSLNLLQSEEPSDPISIPISSMIVTGDKDCITQTSCPDGENKPLTPNCGEVCTSTGDHLLKYEYTFKGDRFQVYGTYDSQLHEYDIYLDNALFATINQNRQTKSEYALQFTSHTIDYGVHTIRISGKGEAFSIYKVAFWPSSKAIRIDSYNISEPWVQEGDHFGGIREWANSNRCGDKIKTLTVESSKFWVIGSFDNGHGNLKVTLDDVEKMENTQKDAREDFAIVHETDFLPFTEHTLKLQYSSGGVCINCIYYLPQEAPTPTPVPLSIPISTMIVDGQKTCNTETQCPEGQDAQPTSDPCGEKCISTGDHLVSYQYQFTGDKFQVYGTYDSQNHEYEVYLDDVLYTRIDQNKQTTTKYALQYTSPVFDYGLHTIKIAGKGQQFEFYKIAYWPSFDAIRVNMTDILDPWNSEGDNFGGLREWANANSKPNVVKNLTIQCTKVWLIGSKESGHGDLKFTADGIVTNINTKLDSGRIDFTVLYETELLLADTHYFLLKYGSDGGVCINCFYYLPCPTPEPTPEPAGQPISIPISSMIVTGDKDCVTQTSCPDGENKPLTPNCGEVCTSTGDHLLKYEYTFKGDRFQVYGTYDSQLHEYDIYLDNVLFATINQNRQTKSEYALQFTSHVFDYGEHTIKISGKGQAFSIYKVAFWPSSEAIRIDSYNINEPWVQEGDHFGGIREWANSNRCGDKIKTLTVESSKFWVIGSFDNGHGNLKVTLDDVEKMVNTSKDAREDFAIVHETDFLPFTEHTLKLQYGSGGVCINCIYYLPKPTPTIPEPVDIPISIPISEMTVVGSNECNSENGDACPSGENAALATKPCGEKCWSNGDNLVTYEYVFTGELVQVYGTFDSNHHKFAIFIDNVYTATVNEYAVNRKLYQVMYTSKLLDYGVHKIKVAGIGEVFEIYKFAFWPSIKAKRLNSTEFTKTGDWKNQADGFGGIREYVENVNGATATKFLYCEKFWVYGSKDSNYGELYIDFGDFDTFFDEEASVHKDFALVYESPLLPYRAENLILTTKGTIKINCIYYHDEAPNPSESPEPTDTPVPTNTPGPTPTEKPPELIILNKTDLVDKRIVKIVDDSEPVKVQIDVSNFVDINHNDNGGAIYIKDSGIICDTTEFQNCTSDKVGGAIYVSNSLDITNEITLDNLKFTQCKADYGGAVYIFTPSEKNTVKIKHCIFTENEALLEADGTQDQKIGGSAIFLTVKKGFLAFNKFLKNIGPGSSVMLYNEFDESSSKLLDYEKGTVVVSDCEFVIDKMEKCSLYYFGGNSGSFLQLNRCKFSGKLENDSHYIDGSIVDNDSPKLDVKNCKFEEFEKNLLKNFLSIDIDMKLNSNLKMDDSYSYKLVAVPIFTVVFVVIIVFIIIKKSQIEQHENENDDPMN